MKMYNKPEMFVTEFAANHAITACTQNPNQTAYEFETDQTVNCFITTSEANLFAVGCTRNAGDPEQVGYSYIISGDEFTYKNESLTWNGTQYWNTDTSDNNEYYYLWTTDGNGEVETGDGGGTGGFFGLLKAAYRAATGVSNADPKGWHIGFISKTLVTQVGQPS